MWSFEMVAAMLAVGAVAGVIAGMFGVGGGTILVPLVLWILQMQGAENFQYAQHIAIGTSFAVMVFTSFASARAQYKRQAVDMDVLRAMAPGVLFGVAAGAVVVGSILPMHVVGGVPARIIRAIELGERTACSPLAAGLGGASGVALRRRLAARSAAEPGLRPVEHRPEVAGRLDEDPAGLGHLRVQPELPRGPVPCAAGHPRGQRQHLGAAQPPVHVEQLLQ